MRFDLEDKKKIGLLCDLIRAISNGRSNVIFVWHRTEGWAVLQNSEYLDNLDGSNLVNLCQIKPHFFSHVSPQNSEFMCFELDVGNLARVLKSTKKQIKRMVWTVYQPDSQYNLAAAAQQNHASLASLQINILSDDGQLEICKDIFLNTRINAHSYFALFREFRQEKTQYLEIQQTHMKQMKELKRNECVFFRFSDEFVTAYNHPDENNISIKKNALEKYDYASLIRNLNGKNRLAIPPNFLVPQILIGLKLKDPIQLFIADEMLDDNICVSLRTKTDSFTFISQFRSVMENDDDDTRQNPFEMFLKSNNHSMRHSAVHAAAPISQLHHGFRNGHQQQQSYNHAQLYSNPSPESHIQGLTNQMHLADPYQNNRNTSSENNSEGDGLLMSFKKPVQQQHLQQQQQQHHNQQHLQHQQQQQHQQSTMKKKVNIVQSDQSPSTNPQNQSNNSTGNNIQSISSTQKSEFPWAGLNSKRKIEVAAAEPINDKPIGFFKETTSSKKIRLSNFTESHKVPPPAPQAPVKVQHHEHNKQQQYNHVQDKGSKAMVNSFVNPLISQSDKHSENEFMSFISQHAKEEDFSIFKSNIPMTTGIQFMPQGGSSISHQQGFRKSVNFIQAKPKTVLNFNRY